MLVLAHICHHKMDTHLHMLQMLHVATLPWEIVRMKLTFPKLGLGSPLGLLKFQNLIIGVKTPRIGVFFISLKSY